MPSTARSTLPEPDLGGVHARQGRRGAARSGPDVAGARQRLCRAWHGHAPGNNTDVAACRALTVAGGPGQVVPSGQVLLVDTPARGQRRVAGRPTRPARCHARLRGGAGLRERPLGREAPPCPTNPNSSADLDAAKSPPAARPWASGRASPKAPGPPFGQGRGGRVRSPRACRRAAACHGSGGHAEVP